MLKRISILVGLLLLFTLPLGGQDDDLEEVDFFLSFVPNIQFSPIYVSIANGHMAEAGLTLNIEIGDENVGVDLIAAGQIEYGMISGEQVILARAQERPVVYVYEWFQAYPIAIVIPDTSDIDEVSDLVGKRVGIPGRFGATYSGLTALLRANDLSESDIMLEPIGFSAPDVVCTGRLDASVVYINNEPLQIQQRADAGECGDITSVGVIAVASQVDLVSNGIVTSEEQIEENAAQVEAIVAAFDVGLRDTINNPAQAYLISLDYVENLTISDEFRTALEDAAAAQAEFLAEEPDREAIIDSREALLADLESQFDDAMLIQFRVLLATIDLWDAEQLGVSDVESWESTLDLLTALEIIDAEVDLEAAYTNQFVPAAADDE
jgi:NitT/TauT family transport system substrate-binding protein